MTIEELELAIMTAHRCTPEQYALYTGKQWDGKQRFIWLKCNLDVGYPIRPRYVNTGMEPNPNSDLQRQPWIDLGISQATYYRRKAETKRWVEIFASLGAQDTPDNRKLYKHLARTAGLTNQPISLLWKQYVNTVAIGKDSLTYQQTPPGESGLSLSSSDDNEARVDPPLDTLCNEGEVEPHNCPTKGPCLVCHTWKV